MAKKQEGSDERQLKRELHETQKTCKYLQGQLKKAEAQPPQKDAVTLRKLEEAERRIAELERILEVKRTQIEACKEQLEPRDDLELRYRGAVAISVSKDGEAAAHGPRVELFQFVTMMSVMADILGRTAEKAEGDFTPLFEDVLSDFVEHPKWREAILNVAHTCTVDGDDDWEDDGGWETTTTER